MCKDSEYYKRAGYFSSSSCTNDVFEGNYDRILNGKGIKSSSISTTTSPVKPSAIDATSSVLPTKQSAVVASPMKSTAAVISPVKSPMPSSSPMSAPKPAATATKLVDLSNLPAAAKKRRALGACKKPDIRKAAGMGSESKCTESVMNGYINRLIEALEYEG